MTEAPKEAWCKPYLGYDYVEDWLDGNWSSKDRGGVKYVRADRIEELEAQLAEQVEWVKGLADDLIAAEGREARLKDKLAKATDVALRLYYGAGVVTDDMHATLAELTGGKDE